MKRDIFPSNIFKIEYLHTRRSLPDLIQANSPEEALTQYLNTRVSESTRFSFIETTNVESSIIIKVKIFNRLLRFCKIKITPIK